MENDTELTLQAFRDAQQQRLELLASGEAELPGEVIARERDALYQHARAVRAHAERLARHGR